MLSNKHRYISLIIILCLIPAFLLSKPIPKLRVGVTTTNVPLAFVDKNVPQGLFKDIFDAVAEAEQWEIEYVPCAWKVCLENLENGVTDLQVAIAYSEKRAEKFDYTRETIFNNWGVIFRHPAAKINSILDFEGKKVALLNRGIHPTSFLSLLKTFNINATIVHRETYPQILKGLHEGEYDGAVLNRTVAQRFSHDYDVIDTHIVFNPVELRFASLKGRQQEVLRAIDENISAMKNDHDSVYVRSLEKWFGTEIEDVVPRWIFLIGGLGIGLIVVVTGISFLLRYQVKKKTKELNKELIVRKNTEKNLRQSEQRFRSLIEDAGVAIILGQKGKPILVNESFLTIFGYESLEEIYALTIGDLIAEEECGNMLVYNERCEKSEEAPERYETIGKKKDEKHFPIEISVSLIELPDGMASAAFIQDISQRRETQNALKLSHDRLEIQVESRTKALQHEIDERIQIEQSLVEAKQEAEAANRIKSDFLANISHELRNPMHQILSYSKHGINKIEKPKEKLLHYFSQTQKAAERLMLLVNDLLDLSKLESGRMDFQLQSNNLSQIINEVVSEQKLAIEEKKLEVILQDSSASTRANCDHLRVGQVIRNLLSNAVKFTQDGKRIEITIVRSKLVKKNSTIASLKVSVSDQGIGIPEDELDSVFDKFTQSSKTKSGAGGTGLGLAICQEIIDAHGGKIWAENNPDGGATFHFNLPYNPESDKVHRSL